MMTAQEYLDIMLSKDVPDHLNWEEMTVIAMNKFANQQTKESLSTIRSLALQLDRKGVKTLIDEIDKMIGEL